MGSAINVTNGNVSVSQEDVELVHEIFGNKLGHVHDVQGVAKNWQVNVMTDEVKVCENISAELHEDDFGADVVFINDDILTFLGASDTKAQQSLLLDGVRGWRTGLESQEVCLILDGKQEHLVTLRVQEGLERVLLFLLHFFEFSII